ncbi:MAG: hypothetical protein K5894_13975 [Lachnospiraceae bacterium]|nr:hypothetical protein [Lachnospiraceae bacterium]
MAKKLARPVVKETSPATVFLKYAVSVYLFLFFVIYPLYYERKYYNMGEAKWHFFKGITFYFKPAAFRGAVLPSVLGMMIIFLAWRMGELIYKKEFKSVFRWKLTSITDKFMIIYMALVGVSCMLSPLKMNVLEATDLDIGYKNNIFWGYSGWHMGLMAQLAFVMLYFIISRYWTYDILWLRVYLGVATAVMILGILTQFMIDPLNMFDGAEINQHLWQTYFMSTLGQSSWYSSFVGVVAAVGVFILWYSDDKISRILALIYSIIAFMTLITDNADSSILAFIGFMSVLFCYSLKNNKKFIRFLEIMLLSLLTWRITGILRVVFPEHTGELGSIAEFLMHSPLMAASMILIALLLFICIKANEKEKLDITKFKFLWWVYIGLVVFGFIAVTIYIVLNTTGKLPESLSTDNNYLFWNYTWGNGRGGDWESTTRSFFESFGDNVLVGLFGPGPDMMHRVAYKYHQEILDAFSSNSRMVCAHNEWLTAFSNYGLLGGAAYLAAFVSSVVRNHKLSKKKPFLICINMCVVAYMAHNFFCYQQIICTPLIFLIMGMGEAIARNEDI